MNWIYLRHTFFLGLIFYVLSFFSFLYPSFGLIVFAVLLLWYVAIAIHDYKTAFLIGVAELVLGSHGHVFAVTIGSFSLSLRIAMFIVLSLSWAFHVYKHSTRPKFLSSAYLYAYIGVFAFWSLGILIGFLNGFPLKDIFSDANGYVFFFYAFFLYDAIPKKEDFNRLLSVSIGALLAAALLTLALLYAFSHELYLPILYPVYRWIRVSGIGEITQIFGGFHRIFFAGHIYAAAALLVGSFVYLMTHMQRGVKVTRYHFFPTMFVAVMAAIVLLSMSRSFWLASVLASVFGIIYLVYKEHNKKEKIFYAGLLGLVLWTLASMLILFVIYFPVPWQSKNYSTGSLFFSRAADLSGDAISSRWSLLDAMIPAIKQNIITGYGFGKTLQYQSDDPRIIELTGDGQLNTYSFEWGYLDIWLKMGFFGLLAVLYYLFVIFKKGFVSIQESDHVNPYVFGFLIAYLALIITHIFTPYLNHPLGIFLVIFTGYFFENKNTHLWINSRKA